jgi:hypothetical protein
MIRRVMAPREQGDTGARRLVAGLACALGMAAAAVQACGGSRPATPPALPPGESASATAASNPVAVSPLPGTPDASATTQISFLGTPGTRLSDVHVTGSRSGPHTGTLRGYSDGSGASFLPLRPFAPGERVSVSARVGTGAAARSATTTFTVAYPATVSQAPFPRQTGDPSAVQHFLSQPELAPTTVTIAARDASRASAGDLFLAPYQGAGAPGPMIAEQTGSLVWFHPLAAGEQAASFGLQRYLGGPVLAWWQGRILRIGFGEGEDVLYDRHYRLVARIRAGNGYRADLHILRVTPQGQAWIDAFAPIRANLSREGGSREGVLSDSVIQEVDVRTGLVMWEWHAIGHIPLGESNTPPSRGSYPWDYVHVNSADLGPDSDLLLSARNTWALYDVDLHSGAVRWRLGGRRSSFSLAPGARFYWQHDGEFQGERLISIFDNGSDPPKESQSRALLLRLDPTRLSASVAAQFANPTTTLLSASQGNALRLSGGNWLVGYGELPNFTEFDPAGNVVLDGTLGSGVQDFTTTLARWSARAPGAPAVALRPSGPGHALLAVSWNGATAVTAWRVLEGSHPDVLRPVTTLPKRGFETSSYVPLRARYVAVQALGSDGRPLGRSRVLSA